MERKWHLKDYKMGSKGKSKKIDRKHVRWKVPAPDWLKLNFDGASRGNLGSSGYGVVVHNNKGELIVGTFGKIGQATNNEAEILALIAGVNICITNKLSNITIEGDSLLVINGIMKSRFENRRLCQWIPCISQLLCQIGAYEVKHIYQEGNRLADSLVNLGIDSPLELMVFDNTNAPLSVRGLIESDIRH
ncbi:hypothetical protein SUGI_1068690 [Cryptomeria japonica]|nr:hypothetical protein SUGI_1068690 [Cryptomeria japonica]